MMMSDHYDAHADSLGCWELAISEIRKRLIAEGYIQMPYQWPEHMGESTRRCATAIVDLIAAAADRGERCPTTTDFVRKGLSNPPISCLADMGILRSEVYGRNWRTIYICQGPHRGKHTKDAPYGKPYKVTGPGRPV